MKNFLSEQFIVYIKLSNFIDTLTLDMIDILRIQQGFERVMKMYDSV